MALYAFLILRHYYSLSIIVASKDMITPVTVLNFSAMYRPSMVPVTLNTG